MKPAILGAVIGFFLGAAAVGVYTARRLEQARAPSAISVTSDLVEGTVLERTHLEEREVPTQFQSDSLVPAEQLDALIGRPLTRNAERGDLLRWAMVVSRPREEVTRTCAERIAPEVERATLAEAEAVFARLSARPRLGSVARLSDPPATGSVDVLVAATDLTGTEPITEEDLEVVAMPARLVTPSIVLAEDRSSLIGAQVVLPIAQGDPLLWQFLGRQESPGVPGCVATSLSVGESARKVSARELARRYFSKQVEDSR